MPESQGVLATDPDADDVAESVASLASGRASHFTGEMLCAASGATMRT